EQRIVLQHLAGELASVGPTLHLIRQGEALLVLARLNSAWEEQGPHGADKTAGALPLRGPGLGQKLPAEPAPLPGGGGKEVDHHRRALALVLANGAEGAGKELERVGRESHHGQRLAGGPSQHQLRPGDVLQRRRLSSRRLLAKLEVA